MRLTLSMDVDIPESVVVDIIAGQLVAGDGMPSTLEQIEGRVRTYLENAVSDKIEDAGDRLDSLLCLYGDEYYQGEPYADTCTAVLPLIRTEADE